MVETLPYEGGPALPWKVPRIASKLDKFDGEKASGEEYSNGPDVDGLLIFSTCSTRAAIESWIWSRRSSTFPSAAVAAAVTGSLGFDMLVRFLGGIHAADLSHRFGFRYTHSTSNSMHLLQAGFRASHLLLRALHISH